VYSEEEREKSERPELVLYPRVPTTSDVEEEVAEEEEDPSSLKISPFVILSL